MRQGILPIAQKQQHILLVIVAKKRDATLWIVFGLRVRNTHNRIYCSFLTIERVYLCKNILSSLSLWADDEHCYHAAIVLFIQHFPRHVSISTGPSFSIEPFAHFR